MLFDPKKFWNSTLLIREEAEFNNRCLQLYYYQSEHVPVYRDYIRLTEKANLVPDHYSRIPFLPVSLFRRNVVTDKSEPPELFFSSSGTTGDSTSRHFVADLSIYNNSLLECFRYFFGSPSDYTFLALLPSYLERKESSLVYMMQKLMNESKKPGNGFFLHDHENLLASINRLIEKGERIFLIGVTFALMDFFEKYPIAFPGNTIVMETGGMKGKRKETVRGEVHSFLCRQTGLNTIHSEYGMTELLTQAYSEGHGIFKTPPWMKVLSGELHDPFALAQTGETGILKIIDLANIHSCAFLETQDLGRTHENGFEVLGRIDHSEWRGCNLMVD